MKIKVNQIKANPYRDMDKYPIDRQKVDALKESIQQTDFWDNLLCRPENNEVPETIASGMPLHAFLAAQPVAFNEDEEPLFMVELAYGHHRLQAIKELGIEEIDIPCKSIENATMLKIMANENKGDWASNMSVILETVRQARQFLYDSVMQYTDYEEYKAAGGSFFSKEQFAQIPTNGIGFRSVTKFLGETWSDQDVRKAVSVLKDIDNELYEQEQIIHFPSVGVLGGFSKLANAIYKQPWPAFFQDEMVREIAGMISDPKMSTTVKILNSATSAANEGKDPVQVIRAPGQKRKDFSVVQAIKDRVYQNMDPDKALKLEDIPEMDGFKDFPDLEQILEDVQKSIDRSEAARNAAGGAGETDGEADADGEAGEAETMSDDALDSMVASAEAEVQPDKAPEMPEIPSEDGAVQVPDAEVFTQSSVAMQAQIVAVGNAWDELSSKDKETVEFEMADIMATVCDWYRTIQGDEVLKEAVAAMLQD